MSRHWTCRDRRLDWENRTLLMGILNVTPDSFSDAGQYFDPVSAIRHADRLFEAGADLVDVGGESSRPGAETVPVEEELRRVLPVVREVAGKGGRLLSIDTVKYEVAARALEAGAAVINDISGLQNDVRLASLAASAQAGLVIMHRRGNPKTMQSFIEYEDLISDLRRFFRRQVDRAKESGVRDSQIALDPGIGFSKTAEQNLTLIHRLREIRLENYPILLGVSRKAFIGKVTGAEVENRLFGTAGAMAAGILSGANIVRVHDVREMREVAAVVDAIRRESVSERQEEVSSSFPSV